MKKRKKEKLEIPQESVIIQDSLWVKVTKNTFFVPALVFILFLIYFLPYLILGENCYIEQFDNFDQISYLGIFDGEFAGSFFPSEQMEEFYQPGIEPIFRVSLLTVPKIFWQFGFLPGYILNEVVLRIVAFLGFYFLLKHYFMSGQSKTVLALVSMTFVYLPFWPQGGLSVAGIPLLLWSLINIQNKERLLLSYLVVTIFPFYSGLFLSGVFILLVYFGYLTYKFVKRENVLRLISPFLLMTILYITVNYPFFLINFYYKIPTNRSGILTAARDFSQMFNDYFLKFFLNTQLHAPSYHHYLILPVSILAMLILYSRKDYQLKRYFNMCLYFILFSGVVYGLYNFNPMNDFYNKLGIGFNYSRFYFITAFIWYLIFAFSCGLFLISKKKVVRMIVYLLLIAQLTINFSFSSYKVWTGKPTIKEVVSADLFKRIDGYLNMNEADYDKKSVRIGCIGFHPAVANFNGFKTLGGYIPIYPLSFKNRFRDVIAGEIEQNKYLKQYYEKWGLQTYLFDNEIFLNLNDQRLLRQKHPDITCELNLEKIREFGVSYLFSSVKIKNAESIGLAEIYRSSGAEDYYWMYVYRL
ncbi:MAG: DUF6044 family protein [Candidatus Cloacimonetes bacterium]|nr:DUF6044 family protein [Candidatus Cloacimonadota bacterium]